MEGGKKSGSSFTRDLFGEKHSSSGGIFSSIFPTPSKSPEMKSVRLSETENKNDSTRVSGEKDQSRITTIKDKSSCFQKEKVQPFNYSSSIYYGGQDVYSQPKSDENPGLTTFNKDAGEDDSGSASRGNWWRVMLLSLFNWISLLLGDNHVVWIFIYLFRDLVKQHLSSFRRCFYGKASRLQISSRS
ncbi:hypothetical protein BUALT_BualtUnG0026800 [Buddleja alternifolia]|uniref:Uncharacterized protein n=1 Tax=Buddleja alternifolia TaxID=168488 RepID=A0AAV6W0Y6_9LAMI|nr:hypothetical protein BUALT_BualtUnG0026800 [Buddleja alternifolia]